MQPPGPGGVDSQARVAVKARGSRVGRPALLTGAQPRRIRRNSDVGGAP